MSDLVLFIIFLLILTDVFGWGLFCCALSDYVSTNKKLDDMTVAHKILLQTVNNLTTENLKLTSTITQIKQFINTDKKA